MRTHVVKPGECLASIADRYGFASWRTIYEDAGNEALRKQRPDPHVLLPGDEVSIPELPEASLELSIGEENTVELKRTRTLLRLQVLDAVEGEPIAARYELRVDGVGAPLRGKVGGDGLIEVEVPARAARASLAVYTDPGDELVEEFELRIGDLDPVTEPSGVRERLLRLGFDPGPAQEDEAPRLEEALRAFQRRYALEVSGTASQETQDKLVALAGA